MGKTTKDVDGETNHLDGRFSNPSTEETNSKWNNEGHGLNNKIVNFCYFLLLAMICGQRGMISTEYVNNVNNITLLWCLKCM